MRPELLAILECPSCGADLRVTAGSLMCDRDHGFPIRDGIPVFAGGVGDEHLFFDRLRQTPSLSLGPRGGDQRVGALTREEFLTQTGTPVEELRGKRVLDAGSGGGRFLELLAGAGIDVVGVDLSLTGLRSSSSRISSPTCHLVQGDLFALPFKAGAFDFIYSLGVLHHTPDPRRAFTALTRCLAPGGRLAIWVYPRPTIGYVSDALRVVTTRLPYKALLALSYVATGPYGPMLRLPVVGRLVRHALSRFRLPWHAEWNWRRHSFMDWYGPKYQFKYAPDELRRWFEAAGLAEVTEGTAVGSMRGARLR